MIIHCICLTCLCIIITISTRIGTGKIFRLVTKGVSDKIVHELGVKYFDNVFSIDFANVCCM